MGYNPHFQEFSPWFLLVGFIKFTCDGNNVVNLYSGVVYKEVVLE